jgi:hypothetical protein
MSGIVGSKLNIRGSGTVAKLGTDGQYLLSSGAGKKANYETVASATYDDDKIQSNIALLGFKTAVNGSLAKYNLQDQIIDEYEDATGIDASASTNELLTSGSYAGTTTATVTGGSTAVDGDYTVHTFTTDANFVTDGPITVDYLIVGGGGGGGTERGGGGSGCGGGGAGGYIYATSQTISEGTHAAVIGTGGGDDADGVDTTFNSLTAGGGGAGGADSEAGNAGRATNGSGGGAGTRNTSPGAGNGTGNDGGDGQAGADAGGGGGGSAAVGGDSTGSTAGGDGGAGTSNSITGSAVYYAAGGGGGVESGSDGGDGGSSLGGDGGDGSQNGQDATGYGNGGGGGGDGRGYPSAPYPTGGDGSDGIVIVRRLTTATTGGGGDLTLQSTDTTAMAEPDYADMVILMENSSGTATINTDIKGYISKDSGSTFTEGTLVDEGTWGTNKKIYAFHDLDISAQSGTSMCYKITTHNQSAGSKVTKIHATSIGWKA